MQFGHKTKIHTIDAGNEGGRKKDDGNHRENLNDFILLQIYQSQESILQIFQSLKIKFGIVNQ